LNGGADVMVSATVQIFFYSNYNLKIVNPKLHDFSKLLLSFIPECFIYYLKDAKQF